ncbi:Chromate resistance protein ChrB [Paenibacillus xerothermodurans]|uniref:ChrB N-terminal domain-containing protein n=1 Tax=Paenibacillus xerothermodurans TaxID=1977292 RepID=A0A2W1NE04_PAEXE|nr:Chromate resistance protein ChrB [Paenibacillus xerothermodurans]PZE21351.1 hypothetical protein CBW46_008300 [Paenibacillus xerothermodurans]
MEIQGWIIFSYKIPSEPSSIRVRVWRNLKTLGVNYIQQSVCIGPNTEEMQKKLKKLNLLISENGGETSLLEVEKMSTVSEEKIISEFNKARTLEYKEFIEESEKFLKEIEKETKKLNFCFREIEENEVELRRLKHWLIKIKKRDFFQCELQKQAIEIFETCNKAFEEFIETVYLQEGVSGEEG